MVWDKIPKYGHVHIRILKQEHGNSICDRSSLKCVGETVMISELHMYAIHALFMCTFQTDSKGCSQLNSTKVYIYTYSIGIYLVIKIESL